MKKFFVLFYISAEIWIIVSKLIKRVTALSQSVSRTSLLVLILYCTVFQNVQPLTAIGTVILLVMPLSSVHELIIT